MFSVFKRKPKGLVAHLKLEDFYSTLTTEEINEIKETLGSPYQLSSYPYKRDDFDRGSRTYGGSPPHFLFYLSGGLSNDLRKKVLLEAIKLADNSADKHFPRTELAEMAYKDGNFTECERYCLEVINELDEEEFKDLRVVAFSRLAIMYEKQNRIHDAIYISERALAIGQHDGTKGGYDGRIARLRKKLT